MRKALSNRGLMAFLAVVTGLLIGNAWLGYQTIQQMRRSSLAVSHTRDVILALERIISFAKDAETGQRGYLITGENRYLEPYRSAVGAIDEQLKLLEDLAANNGDLRSGLPALKGRIESRMAILREAIDARRTQGFIAARDLIANDRGKKEMDALRGQVDEMIAQENRARASFTRVSAHNYAVALGSSWIGDAVAIVLVIAFAWLLRRHLVAQKQAEETLHEQREVFRTTIESIGDAVLTTDTNGLVTSLNPVAQKLTGWIDRDAQGQRLETVFSVVNDQTGAPAENPVARVLRDGLVVDLANHTLLIARDGRRIPIDDSAAPIRVGDGGMGGVVMVFRDVSERRKADAALQVETRTLETLNRVGRAVAAELELDRVVQVATDAATELCGAAFGAFFYNRINEKGESYLLFTLSGAPREAFEKLGMPRNTAVFASTFTGASVVRVDDITKDARYGHNWPHKGMPQGHLPVRSYLAAPVVSRSGEVIGGLFFGHPEAGVFTERSERIAVGVAAQAAIAIDNARLYQAAQQEIEQRRRAEDALRQSEEKFRRQAEELERQLIASGRLVSVGEITASMAHEFNNPLGIILGFAEEVRGDLVLDDPNRRALEIIEEETRRCQKIIQELLQFTRPTGPELAWTRVSEVVEKSLALVENHLYKQKIELHKSFDIELPDIYIDAKQLEQVLLNLFFNAMAAMPHGGQLTVQTKVATPIDGPTTGVIVVKDTGSGIDPGDLPKIFEPFFTAKKRTGLGLGLSVCERIVKNHGGRIEVKSQLGEGTQITIYLPLEPNTTVRAATVLSPTA